MEVLEYNKKYEEQVKDLLVELQEYIVSIDTWGLNIITPKYRQKYFEKTMLELSSNEGKMFLAVDSGNVLGMICGHIIKYEDIDKIDYKCPKSGTVDELIVSSKCRAKGVGNALLKTMENHLKSVGCEYCHIDVFEPNVIGKNFYSKNQYTTRLRCLSKKI